MGIRDLKNRVSPGVVPFQLPIPIFNFGGPLRLEPPEIKPVKEILAYFPNPFRRIPSDDQVIYPEWIQYYDELPRVERKGYRGTYAGVDLTIAAKDSADFTTVVMAHIYSRRKKMRIYILPNPIVQELNFPAQVDLLKYIKRTNMRKHSVLCS